MNSITLADLERFGAKADAGRAPDRRAEPPSGSPTFSNELADWPAIVAGCAFAAHCVSHAAALPEPFWYAVAGLLGRCDEGHRQFHELSKADERYDSAETDQKLEHACTASAPRTCRSIRDDLGFDGCSRCPLWRHA
ncbi:hypothetical protein [Brevundimonas sp. TWP3-1-2b1]|uniref:hypothetical protein n=1 Tax=Brevundimonas sp. TWP3-1-2b1 TaxID=2804650 RepID=UPI003CF537D5